LLYQKFHLWPADVPNFQRIAASHGVVLLNPVMDWRVAVTAFELPDSAKLGDGWTKRILRDAFAPLLPEAVVRRRDKLGFTAPMLDWTARGLRTVMVQAARDGLVSSSGGPDLALSEAILAADVRDDVLALRRSWPLVQRSMLVTRFRNG
jgi:asparagine synthetase B (glutamine-hydrolysing)